MALVRPGSRHGVTQDVAHLGFEAATATSSTATQLLLDVVL